LCLCGRDKREKKENEFYNDIFHGDVF